MRTLVSAFLLALVIVLLGSAQEAPYRPSRAPQPVVPKLTETEALLVQVVMAANCLPVEQRERLKNQVTHLIEKSRPAFALDWHTGTLVPLFELHGRQHK